MKPFKHHLSGSTLSTILIVLLLVIYISGGIVSSSCNSGRTNSCDTAAIVSLKCPSGTGTQSLYNKYLDTLKMDRTDYEILRNTFPSGGAERSKLVLQFYFNSTMGETPSLIAYASKPGNKFTTGAVTTPVWKILTKGGASTFLLPDEFVLGDQQIKFDAIDGIIGASTSYTLLFIPTIESGEKNVRYYVCIDKGAGPVCAAPPPPTQPSPPANAN